jgi:acyl-coenzyme A synthetase/AMP-(fatty) acid ligase
VSRERPLLFDQLWAARSGARPWVVDHGSPAVPVRDGQVELRDLAVAAGRAATLFEAQDTGIGDYCVVWLDEPLDVLVVLAGLTAVGAIPVLLSPAIDGATLARIISTSTVPIDRVITTSSRLAACPEIRSCRRIDDWDSLARQFADLPPRQAGVNLPDTARYVATHTSGTTGVNKLVQYNRAAVIHNAYTHVLPARIGRLRGPAAVHLSPVHFRMVVGVSAALRLDLPLIILSNPDPASVGPILERWKPEYLETHPNTFRQWEPLAALGSMASVKCFLSTFDVIHPNTVKALLAGTESRFAVLWEIYGQSEVCAIAGRLHVKGLTGKLLERNPSRRLGGHYIGWAVPWHSETRIVDDAGNPVRRGVEGRIQVRSKGRFSTYLNRQDAARTNLTEDGWWDSGDHGRKGRFGALTLIDRQVERMATIPSAVALEDVLLDRMPWLLEAVVLEHGGGLAPVVAVRAGTFDEQAWASAVEDLPALAAPVVLDDDEIPRTATGKVQRATLAARLTGSPPAGR